MENYEDREIKEPPKSTFTIFGDPIVTTNCQRNALLSGISGGIISGLIGFLFTSNPRQATRIGVGSYFVITVTFACYCAYDEYEMKRQTRLIRQSLVQAHLGPIKQDSTDTPVKLDEA
ncbi:cytochrome c oxidase assembly protein COX20, mitochondrial [Ceratina calcarata]|uniref:Cytochrome c oxidase assembly protein COX20, mitochondrial n=1 Tax=Ceratina calcarata TaxID=156304 RepID=A0AAJ7JEV2_9HYME|nr:cytochrome c oxidase assembly protein COX20, mitochondrial [Ceratina calcarata]